MLNLKKKISAIEYCKYILLYISYVSLKLLNLGTAKCWWWCGYVGILMPFCTDGGSIGGHRPPLVQVSV